MRRETTSLLLVALPLAFVGCSKDEPSSKPAASASATAVASASAPAPAASAAPSASAAADNEPHHDCPADSTGPGSYAKPCEAKGKIRMMEVQWKKTEDKGPQFAVKNVGKLVIVWGRIAVYFYDKAGKQMDTKDESGKPIHSYTCSGQIFGGVMNPAEKEYLTFDCVPKKVIPDGVATIEAEIPMVGFADASGKKIDFYWRNADLVPDARPKGGVK